MSSMLLNFKKQRKKLVINARPKYYSKEFTKTV